MGFPDQVKILVVKLLLFLAIGTATFAAALAIASVFYAVLLFVVRVTLAVV